MLKRLRTRAPRSRRRHPGRQPAAGAEARSRHRRPARTAGGFRRRPSSTLAALRGCLHRPARRRPEGESAIGAVAATREERSDGVPLIEAVALTRRFGDFVAADQVSFQVRPRRDLRPARSERRRQVHHLQDALRTAASPSGGAARWSASTCAPSASAGQAKLGYMAQKFSLYGDLSVRAEPRVLRRRLRTLGRARSANACSRHDRHLRARPVSSDAAAEAAPGLQAAPGAGLRADARAGRSCSSTSRPPASIRSPAASSGPTSTPWSSAA